ncbi:MAG: deoxyhypusine synthase family protein [Nanoarchaeota archaeon]|nr:deoxyhypusine synthase family protein [Nanoarchaeota archaeon]
MVQYIEDFKWKKSMTTKEFVEKLGSVGYQSIELKKAAEAMAKMKREGAKIFLTFTSNMVTSGLRGFFAQTIEKGLAQICVTTIGGIEEDIMKADGEKFMIGSFHSDDYENHEKGLNRVGNVFIDTQSYMKLEDKLLPILEKLYKIKKRWTPSEIFREIGLILQDENSILYQAAKNNVPIFCPAITDGSFGFHLYLFQQEHPDFIVDIIADFKNIVLSTDHNEKKAVICLGGSISKHHAILATLLNGGAEYAVYMTTAKSSSGSLSGATTQEAKSWGKIKDDSDAVTVHGDVSILFPLAMSLTMEILSDEGIID